jgi:hypothetical protein
VTTPVDSAKLPDRSSHGPSSLAVAAAFFAILICGWIARVQAQISAGSVTEFAGTASLQRAGNNVVVGLGTVVDVGDQITVSSGHLTIVLTDGSVLKAGSTSVLVIDEQLLGPRGAVASTKILLAGIMRAIVVRTSSGNPPNFQVHTPNAILSVRGTEFDTAYSDGASRSGFGECTRFTDVKAYEGLVGARNAALPSSTEITIGAGYETTIACDAPPLPPEPLGMTGIPFGAEGGFVGDVPGSPTAPPAPPQHHHHKKPTR